jgi:hypothetical protein
VIRAGRIAGGRADAAVFLADQRLVGQLLARGIAPKGGADVLVQALGEGFGKAVGQRFEQDVVVIVVLGAEALQVRLDPVDADGEAADPVAIGIDEIGRQKLARSRLLRICWRRNGKRTWRSSSVR